VFIRLGTNEMPQGSTTNQNPAVYVVEPSYFQIGLITDSPETLTANLNKIIASGYGYYTDGDVVAGVRILGKFSKL
jgi:hypothetical protein